MGFVELENKGKQIFEQFPAAKRAFKRAYQLGMYSLSNEKIKSEGNLMMVSPFDKYEYYFGYYDKSPWDADDRYIICLRANQTYKEVAPKESAQLLLLDTKNNYAPIKIATTNAWNVQQGCMAQWLGPDFKTRIIYNEYREGSYCSIIYNIIENREERVFNHAVYDVAKDGSYALSLDFSRLHRMRPGYGYSNLPDTTKEEHCPNKTAIWKLDLSTGESTPLKKYTDFRAFETSESMDGAEHKVNHLMISPDGNRFMVLHRWFKKGRKHTRLITMNTDGSEMYNLSDDTFVSHCYWKNNEEILGFVRKNGTGDHYYLMKDKTQEYKILWPELNTDGHCSYSPDGRYIITDTYPNRKRLASLHICTECGENGSQKRIARVFAPFRYDNNCRCDLHPRWNRAGDKVCIDSVHDGKRGLYVMDIENKINSIEEEEPLKIIFFVTRLRKSGPISQTLDLIRHLDKQKYAPIIVSLYGENKNDSMLEEYYKAGAQYYCLNMSRIKSIVSGNNEINGIFKNIQPDLIHSVGMPLYKKTKKYRKCPSFTTIHNYVFDDYPVKYGKFIGNIMAMKDIKIISRNNTHMVTCSESLSKIYKNNNGISIDFIRNGVDTSRYKGVYTSEKVEIRKKLSLPKDRVIAIFTGQVCARKNQEFAVQGILNSNRKDLCLVLLGTGPDLESLKEKYSGNDNIIWRGQVNNVNEYLQAGDIYISSSTSEGLPIGVLEAMSAGLPPLLSDILQHKEVLEVEDDLGIVFKNNDLESFEKALNKLLDQDLKEYGDNCNKVTQTILSARCMADKYQSAYTKEIGRYKHE